MNHLHRYRVWLVVSPFGKHLVKTGPSSPFSYTMLQDRKTPAFTVGGNQNQSVGTPGWCSWWSIRRFISALALMSRSQGKAKCGAHAQHAVSLGHPFCLPQLLLPPPFQTNKSLKQNQSVNILQAYFWINIFLMSF